MSSRRRRDLSHYFLWHSEPFNHIILRYILRRSRSPCHWHYWLVHDNLILWTFLSSLYAVGLENLIGVRFAGRNGFKGVAEEGRVLVDCWIGRVLQ